MKAVIMKSTLRYLTLMYLWPKSENSTTKSGYLVLLSGSFLLTGGFIRLIVSIAKDENVDRTENAVNVISQFGVMYFAVFFLRNRNNFQKIISDLSDFSVFGKPPNFEIRNKKIDDVGLYFGIAVYIAIVVLIFWPTVYTKDCIESGEKVCGLVTPTWLPFEFSHFPAKQFVYFWQVYCCFVTYGAAGILSFAMSETMEHLVVRIQHLKFLIGKVVEEPDKTVRQRLLAKWVQYHLYIFEIGKEMNTSYRISLFVHVLVAGALFGFIGHKLAESAATINTISLFNGWFSSMCVVCLGGQHLMDESISVGMAAYNTKWYKQDVKFQKNIIPIMLRSQKPILIYAGPLSNLSFLLILGVLQTAYSYVNLLNAV